MEDHEPRNYPPKCCGSQAHPDVHSLPDSGDPLQNTRPRFPSTPPGETHLVWASGASAQTSVGRGSGPGEVQTSLRPEVRTGTGDRKRNDRIPRGHRVGSPSTGVRNGGPSPCDSTPLRVTASKGSFRDRTAPNPLMGSRDGTQKHNLLT